MDIDNFWKLIEKSKRESNGNFDVQVDIVVSKLKRLSIINIIKFDRIFGDHYLKLHSSTIWAAAELIKDWCSDDSYDYFRAWLIGQGKDIYEVALVNPDNLADIESISEASSGELLMYAASYAYEEKTGEDDFDELLLDEELTENQPTGGYQNLELEWIKDGKEVPEKLKQMLPKLYRRFRENDNNNIS